MPHPLRLLSVDTSCVPPPLRSSGPEPWSPPIPLDSTCLWPAPPWLSPGASPGALAPPSAPQPIAGVRVGVLLNPRQSTITFCSGPSNSFHLTQSHSQMLQCLQGPLGAALSPNASSSLATSYSAPVSSFLTGPAPGPLHLLLLLSGSSPSRYPQTPSLPGQDSAGMFSDQRGHPPTLFSLMAA